MYEALIALLSAMIGTAIGVYATWFLTTRAARNQARREILVKVMEALQDYRVAYAQWYTEYLSPQAQVASGHWAKPPTGKPDPMYIELMRAVDMQAGRLRVLGGVLYAHFPTKVIKPIFAEVMKVLVMTGPGHKDCREVDQVAEGACSLIPDLMKKYL